MVSRRKGPPLAQPLLEAGDVLRDVNERLVISSLRERDSAELADQRRAQLNALLEALTEGVVIADGSGHVLMVNAAARAILAIELPTLEQVNVVDLRAVSGAPLPVDEHPLRRAMRGEAFTDVEMLLVRADGETRHLLTSGVSTRKDEQIELAIIVLRDVTTRRRLEERLAQSERLAAIGTLSAGMAHEINNPLSFVLANVDFALEELDQIKGRARALGGPESNAIVALVEPLAEALGEAREGSLRVHRIISDLQRFGRLDGGEPTVLALVDVLEGALRITGHQVRARATLRRVYQRAPSISANEGQLGQVFVNLLMNAAQAVEGSAAAAADAEIVVSIHTDAEGRAVAEVRDSGPGIPREIQRHIFEPFFTTKAVGQGSGLGLSICHSVVQSIGGDISVESEPGRGATFRVVLPAAARGASTTPPAIDPEPVPPRRGRVLLVDDEPAIGRTVRRILQKNHDVFAFADPGEALAYAVQGEAFDVVFCDLMMPDMTGEAFYLKLRDRRPELADKVIFLTGGAVTAEARAFLGSTRNLTLLKPVTPGELRRVVVEAVVGAPATTR